MVPLLPLLQMWRWLLLLLLLLLVTVALMVALLPIVSEHGMCPLTYCRRHQPGNPSQLHDTQCNLHTKFISIVPFTAYPAGRATFS